MLPLVSVAWSIFLMGELGWLSLVIVSRRFGKFAEGPLEIKECSGIPRQIINCWKKRNK